MHSFMWEPRAGILDHKELSLNCIVKGEGEPNGTSWIVQTDITAQNVTAGQDWRVIRHAGVGRA